MSAGWIVTYITAAVVVWIAGLWIVLHVIF
jgi:hypothetical protein